MSIVIPNSLNINRVFSDPNKLLEHAEHRAENSPKLDCQSNAFRLIARIEPHKRGYKLVSLFYLDTGLVEQLTFNDEDLYTFRQVEHLAFTEEE